MKIVHKLFCFLFVLILLVGCKTTKVSQTDINIIPEGEWVMQSMHQKPVSVDYFGRSVPKLTFLDSAAFSGTTGCNRFMATYKNTSENFTIKMGPMTKMACPGGGEKDFVNTIAQVNRVDIENGVLTFYKDDTRLMKFEKSEVPIKKRNLSE